MFIVNLLAKVPLWLLYRLSDVLYGLIAYVVRYRRAVITDNLRQSFPDRSAADIARLRRGFYRNFCDLLVEIIKLPGLSADELRKRVQYTNPELVRDSLEAGKPVIGLASHHCNWEWLPAAATLYGMPVDSVYKPLHNAFFEQLMIRIRSTFGPVPVPMGKLPRQMAVDRNRPRIIALVADQMPDRPENAYWTDFMHRNTPFYPGLERLARGQQLPVFYIEMVRVRRGYYTATFTQLGTPPYGELATGELIERYRDALTNTLEKHPADWLWSHKRWKHHREKYDRVITKLE